MMSEKGQDAESESNEERQNRLLLVSHVRSDFSAQQKSKKNKQEV